MRALAPGASATVVLTMAPEYHAVVIEGEGAVQRADPYNAPTVTVEAGPVELFVGGLQPAFGAPPNATVLVTATRALDAC